VEQNWSEQLARQLTDPKPKVQLPPFSADQLSARQSQPDSASPPLSKWLIGMMRIQLGSSQLFQTWQFQVPLLTRAKLQLRATPSLLGG
jgi:hypothetical protein